MIRHYGFETSEITPPESPHLDPAIDPKLAWALRHREPFVGPAGQVLDQALAEVGLPRGGVYLTNAVKHFNWEPRGQLVEDLRKVLSCLDAAEDGVPCLHPEHVDA